MITGKKFVSSPFFMIVTVLIEITFLFLVFTPFFYLLISRSISDGVDVSTVAYVSLGVLRFLLMLALCGISRKKNQKAMEFYPRQQRMFTGFLICTLLYTLLYIQGTVWKFYLTVTASIKVHLPGTTPLFAAVLWEQLLDGNLFGCILLSFTIIFFPKVHRRSSGG